jgi:hypothetical protein
MKKLLQLKTITFSCILVLFFSGRISAQELLIYVADTNSKQVLSPDGVTNDSVLAEAPTIAIFEEDGYDVQIFQITALSTAEQSVIDMLNEADLIYIGRRVASSNFQSPNKEIWNGLYPPIMTENMWALRGGANMRMNWFNSDGIYTNTTLADSALVYASLEDPDDEIFEGLDELFEDLDLTDTIAWWYGSHNTIDPAGDFGNGTLMASASTPAGDKPIWIRFEAGDEFYTGSVDLPEGDRVYFGLGCERDNLYQYYSRYTEVSKEIFLREAARLSWHWRGESDVKKLDNGAVASKAYFNPVIQKLVVEMDNLNKVEVFDISGKLVYATPAKSNKLYIDIGFTESGIYVVRLFKDNNNFSTNKIVK